MQYPTHIASGILIDNTARRIHPAWLRMLIVATLCYGAHGVLDGLDISVYDPRDLLLFNDSFWCFFQVVVAITTYWMLVVYWKKHMLAITFSLLPDLDWVMVWFLPKCFHIVIPFWKTPILHGNVMRLARSIPLFNTALEKLPDLRLTREAVLIEIALFILIMWLARKAAKIQVAAGPRSK